jgi:hypothetical protein
LEPLPPTFTIRHACGAELDDTEHRAWQASVIRGMPELRLAELFRLKPDLLRECDHVVTASDCQGEFAGVVATRWFAGHPAFLQLAISLIQGRHQRGSLLRELWHTAFQAVVDGLRSFPAVIALRTYNPAAFQAMRAFALIPGVAIYPRIDGGEQDPAMMQLAGAVAEHVAGKSAFDPRTGVLARAGVPLDFYAALPDGGRDNVRRYFRAHVAAGDRLLCVLCAKDPAARQRICDAFGLRTSGVTTKRTSGVTIKEEPHV